MASSLADLARFAGAQFRSAFEHMDTHGWGNTALGTTVTGWWNSRYHLHVLETDDLAYVETMAMEWLCTEHKKARFVGVVMNGKITIKGKTHNSLILRSRASDQSLRMMAYNPYYGASDKEEPWVTPFIDFPADYVVPPETRKALEEIMITSSFGRSPHMARSVVEPRRA
ncbi:hypothetical protein [Bradyrhizobium guangxiense]|uniref:hypothetical protein n=1 Tax=Bradyrhizobium guangxiense TaxID=1325115 RepID=UPI00100924DF|nr:hypothetical protein [Bradyrhizobium guangxiense]